MSRLQGFSEAQTLDLADDLFSAGFYDEAITEYKRFAFFNPGNQSASFVHYKAAIAYREQGKWAESITQLHHAINWVQDDSIRNRWQLVLANTYIVSGNYSAAEIILLRLQAFSRWADIRKGAFFFRGIAGIYSYRWKSAQEAFKEYFDEYPDSSLQVMVDSLLLSGQQQKYKSPIMARMLSTFLPGAGQFYAGDIKNGTGALVLNAGLGFWIVYNIVQGNYGDGLTIYFFLFRRYYSGNRYHAERLVRERNQCLNQVLGDRAIRTLLKAE